MKNNVEQKCQNYADYMLELDIEQLFSDAIERRIFPISVKYEMNLAGALSFIIIGSSTSAFPEFYEELTKLFGSGKAYETIRWANMAFRLWILGKKD